MGGEEVTVSCKGHEMVRVRRRCGVVTVKGFYSVLYCCRKINIIIINARHTRRIDRSV